MNILLIIENKRTVLLSFFLVWIAREAFENYDKQNRIEYETRLKELRNLLSNLEGERSAGFEEGVEIG